MSAAKPSFRSIPTSNTATEGPSAAKSLRYLWRINIDINNVAGTKNTPFYQPYLCVVHTLCMETLNHPVHTITRVRPYCRSGETDRATRLFMFIIRFPDDVTCDASNKYAAELIRG